MEFYIDKETISKEIILKGAIKYRKIMSIVNTTDVSKNEDFQKLFNGFYRVRQRNEEWYKEFYSLFEDCKKNPKTYDKLLLAFYNKTKRIEKSFISKMVATLNPDMPIWDVYVIQNLGIKLKKYFSGRTRNERKLNEVKYYCEIYKQIVDFYNSYLATKNAKDSIAEFNRVHPSYKDISDTKKIDFCLWSMRDGEQD
ncbi:MAG: hypothetical protein WC929_05635 [Bacilli bacterium]|jgi:hypothetical protein